MAVCPQCGATVAEGEVVCGSCNALVTKNPAVQTQVTPDESRSAELNARLEKAMRRTELLSYAVAGLGVAILVVIILISFL